MLIYHGYIRSLWPSIVSSSWLFKTSPTTSGVTEIGVRFRAGHSFIGIGRRSLCLCSIPRLNTGDLILRTKIHSGIFSLFFFFRQCILFQLLSFVPLLERDKPEKCRICLFFCLFFFSFQSWEVKGGVSVGVVKGVSTSLEVLHIF